MIKIYFKYGADGTLQHLQDGVLVPGLLVVQLPIDAEAAYFSHIRHRTDGAGAVKIDSSRSAASSIVPSAYYRTDAGWHGGPREQDMDRRGQIWSMLDGGTPRPSVFQVRGLARAHNLTGRQIAELVGADDRTVRRWLSESERWGMPPTAWSTLLARLGYLVLSEP